MWLVGWKRLATTDYNKNKHHNTCNWWWSRPQLLQPPNHHWVISSGQIVDNYGFVRIPSWICHCSSNWNPKSGSFGSFFAVASPALTNHQFDFGNQTAGWFVRRGGELKLKNKWKKIRWMSVIRVGGDDRFPAQDQVDHWHYCHPPHPPTKHHLRIQLTSH